MRQYVQQGCFKRLTSQAPGGKASDPIAAPNSRVGGKDGFAEEVAELWEPWMRVVAELLED